MAAAALLLLAPASPAQPFYQRLWSFGPSSLAGSFPRGALLEASDGRLYGTTYGGGTNGFGSVFSIDKVGQGFSALYSFDTAYFPCGGLVEATNGTLCGTTSSGASSSGTVFRLNKDGSGFSVLHSFPAFTADGAQPAAGLTVTTNGLIYGTTQSGGTTNAGTLFSLAPNGTGYRVLHSFTGTTNGADGSSPAAGLCLGADGALYGTTQTGGSNNLGTIFKLNQDGTGYKVLYHFSGAPLDGRVPYGGLAQGKDGRLYGTTYYGGTNDLGTIFSLTTNGGSYTVMMSFPGGDLGSQPFDGVVQGADGRLYGTTRYGGSQGGGTVFVLSTNGSGYTILHSFAGPNGDASTPLAGLLRASNGSLYGSTYWGGDYVTNGVDGTLFRLYTPAALGPLSVAWVGGHSQLSFSGPTGQQYSVLMSTNVTLPLAAWTVLTNGTFSGPASFIDTNTAASPARFYRLRSP